MFRLVSSSHVCCGAAAFMNADVSIGIGTFSRRSMQGNYSEGILKSSLELKRVVELWGTSAKSVASSSSCSEM